MNPLSNYPLIFKICGQLERFSTLKFKFNWNFLTFSDSSSCVKRHEFETLIVGASLHFKPKYRNLQVSTWNILWRSTAYTFKFTFDSLKVNLKKLLCGCRCIIQLIKENREEISEYYDKIQRKIVKLNFHGRHWSTSTIYFHGLISQKLKCINLGS